MANMAHCRFTNTLEDLQDCYVNMDKEDEDLGTEEAQNRRRLIKLCGVIDNNYGED